MIERRRPQAAGVPYQGGTGGVDEVPLIFVDRRGLRRLRVPRGALLVVVAVAGLMGGAGGTTLIMRLAPRGGRGGAIASAAAATVASMPVVNPAPEAGATAPAAAEAPTKGEAHAARAGRVGAGKDRADKELTIPSSNAARPAGTRTARGTAAAPRTLRIEGTVVAGGRAIEEGSISDGEAMARLQAGGHFVLEGLAPGRHVLGLATASGSFAAVGSRTEVELIDRDLFLPIDIGERFAVAVQVADEEGRPVADLPVRARAVAGKASHSRQCVTDAEGTCRFDEVPRGRLVEVTPGLGMSPVSLEVPRALPLLFIVPTTGRVEGVLRREDGRPGRCRVVTMTSANDDGSPARHVTRSDGRGAFSFDHLPPGDYELTARLAGGPEQEPELRLAVEVRPRQTQRVELAVDGDSLAGAPVAVDTGSGEAEAP